MQSSNDSNAHSGSREPPSAVKGACLAAGLALGAVTLAAAVLRCWQMGESLWIDELHTAWTAADGLAQVAPRAWIGNQSPLYFYLVWGLVKLFGLSEPVVRLPSLLAGVALVPAMYFVLLRWTASKTAALLAAVLTAVDPHCLLYSLEARPYALVQLLALAHVWVFSELLRAPSNGRARPLPSRNVPTNVAARREPRPPDVKSSSEASVSKRPVHRGILPWRLAFILGAAVLFYLHYTAALLLPAEMLAYVALWPWRRRRMAYRAWQFALDLAIVALAWFPAVWHLREIAARRENWSFVQQGPITATPFWFPLPYALLWPAVLLAAAALIHWLLRRRALAACFSLPLAVLAAGWEFVPALIAWAATQLDVARLFHLRYLNVSVPAAPAIAGLLCGWTAGRVGRLAQLVVISAAAVYASNLVPLYLHDGRFAAHDSEDWRAAVQLVNEHRGSGPAPVLVYSGLIEARQMAHGGQSLRRYLLLPVTGIYRLEGDDRLLVALPESDRVRLSSAQREGAEDAGALWLLVRCPAAEVEFFKREVLAMLGQAGVPAEQVSVMRQPFGDVTVFRLSWRSGKGR